MSMNRKDEKFQFIPFSFFVRQTANARIPREERSVALEMEKFSSRAETSFLKSFADEKKKRYLSITRGVIFRRL